MTVTSTPHLFQPISVGTTNLKHRVVMAPLTRFRSPNHVPNNLVAEYYGQRASVEGTLLISEATLISPEAGGYDNVPGIWSQDQIAGWNKVTDAIHAKGSKFFLQLWSLGRLAKPEVLEREGLAYISASNVPLKDTQPPRPITREEISDHIRMYANAAKNAIAAGADGVEIHNANGYLLDQFLRENSNTRVDEYGGSIENRARFTLEVVDAVVAAVGADKVGIRLSPWSPFGELDPGVSPIPQFSYIVTELEKRRLAGHGLAYIHAVEPRVRGHNQTEEVSDGASNRFIFDIWQGPVIRAGGMTPIAIDAAQENNRTLVAMGRYFIANPDLPFRLANGIDLTHYDRPTFYTDDPTSKKGYTTYLFSDAFKASKARLV